MSYTKKDIQKVDKIIKELETTRAAFRRDVLRKVTTWGKNSIDYKNLKMNVEYIMGGRLVSRQVIITLYYDEFGAGMELKYDPLEQGVGKVQFNMGAMGYQSVKEAPKRMEIVKIYAKLIENIDMFVLHLDDVYKKHVTALETNEKKFNTLMSEQRDLVKYYFELKKKK